MRHVQFAQNLAQKFGKIIVVVDVGEETAVVLHHYRPVNAVHPLVVEAGSLLHSHIVEHGLTLGSAVNLMSGIRSDGCKLVGLGIEFLHLGSHEENGLAVLGCLQ